MKTNSLPRVLVAIVVTALIGSACSKDMQAGKRRYVQSGDEYVAQGKFAEAIVEYRNAIKIDARDGDTRYKLAGTLVKAGPPFGLRRGSAGRRSPPHKRGCSSLGRRMC
jgi:Tfp pilus assembly protein PilF